MAGFDNITLQTSTPQCCIIHTLTLCSQQYEMKVAAKHTCTHCTAVSDTYQLMGWQQWHPVFPVVLQHYTIT